MSTKADMLKLGYKFMSEEHGPADLVGNAKRAEEAGFEFAAISDHFSPWLDEQGHAPLAWPVLGAIANATQRLGLMTAVRCPITRYHPAIVAQSAATLGLLGNNRFTLGLGAGERLNEHVVGAGWPGRGERQERLSEAIDIIQGLLARTLTNYRGNYFRLDHAPLGEKIETVEKTGSCCRPQGVELATIFGAMNGAGRMLGQGAGMNWVSILAYVTGTVDQELLLRNEYLVAENRILKAQLKGRLRLSDAERATLGEIGHRLGRKVLGEVANVARPDTILAWYRKLVARKFDGWGWKARRSPGRPRIKRAVEQLIVRMAKENRDWGYDRIAGALANLGYEVCDPTVGNVLRRHALPPAPERKRTTPWPAFIRTHLALPARTDFFTAEALTLRGLVTYYVLFFIHLESRRVDIAGITVHPDERWMQQIARNVTMEGCGALRNCHYLLHDRDAKYTQSFRAIIASGQVEPLALPARSLNLNAFAERWVRSVKEECLSKVILFGERSLRRALSEYVEHFHAERNPQGKGNVLLFPRGTNIRRDGPVQCRERLGGLLRYYHHEAA